MAYNDDAVLAKLSALNETQESIVTVAQWVMFHRRHADRTGQLWLQRLKDSGSNKRLNLIYLANEVAQQSKARRKDDFLVAFSPVIAEATACAYKGATNEVQQKLRRVVEVWRSRQIFEIPIQESIESRIDDLDKTRSNNNRSGGSIFSSSANSVPSELQPLVTPQQTISKLVLSTKTSVNAANQDYTKLTDPNTVAPTPPVHAARLNGLLKTLANAEGAVAESIKARQLLIEGLEKILDTNRSVLASEEAQMSELQNRRAEIDNKKRDVEESIMRGFSNSNPATPVGDGSPGAQHTPMTPGQHSGSVEPDRPEVEALTPPGYPQPPAVEPIPEYDLNQNNNQNNQNNHGNNGHHMHTNGHGNHNLYQQDYTSQQSPTGAPGLDLLSSLSTTYARPASGGSAKKRKLNDEFPDLGGEDAMDGLDDEVVGILNKGL
ncbi:probable RTT103 Regulator of Ty1 Transposition [Rhynchosporium secalis]|uniref:Probable RTT103 Regulator of Ty1 Transposition n=1 Tax=Rhynchosporium secalis TaxID=38038 RepID=A0A1E1MPS3_RHYSE|nr:probable RTT103 Regulator of Ty1 Transposition [Rhynchosporium secalis]